MIALFVFVFFPLTSYAANGYAIYTLKAFGSLLVVISLLFIAMYLLKKANIASRFKSSRIKVVDRLFIDNKHSIVIVEIDNREYALGVGEDIKLITKLKDNNEE